MPARLSQELIIFKQLEAQDKIHLTQEAAEMVEKQQRGSKRAAAAPALSNKAKKAKKDTRDELEEEDESFPDLSAKELEQRRMTGHDIVKDAMRTEGVVEKWRWQHKKPCINCGDTRECKRAPKEICCKTCVERKMRCLYVVDFSLGVLEANSGFSSDLSCYIAAHIKTVTVKVAWNKGMLPSAPRTSNKVMELSGEELGEEDDLGDDDGEAKKEKGKGSSPGKRKLAKSAGSSNPPPDALKILLRPWQVQVALPCVTTSTSSRHNRSSTTVAQDQGVELDRLESGRVLSARDEEGLFCHAALDTVKAELRETRRELGNLVAEVSRLERIVQMRDQELCDFEDFEDFQYGFADCVCEHFISNREVMSMVEVKYQAVCKHLITLGRLVGNDTGMLAGSLRLVMRHLEGIKGGLERALACDSQTHNTHLLPMGAGGAPSLEDCLWANLSPAQEIGHMWGWKHEDWLCTKDSHTLARILEERRNDDDKVV
ncbi:hypothetical protein BDQ12DRAFT_661800 [Crucibulum laeve]|uniref:Uncharacterized protein n=1 Tax=Crucibulum laeve TaxID=68775 RepID=A0A5C3MDR8_9AGAR|nr:hypothetical protein BDQ12DRAFT_661800 [Crucibulum laeve]